jgi:hypothetical protein
MMNEQERQLMAQLMAVLTDLIEAGDQADAQTTRSVELAATWPGIVRTRGGEPHTTCGVPWAEDHTERCGLLAGHTGSHLSWPGGFHFAIREAADPRILCGVKALTCMYHDPAETRDCPRTPHDHPACTYHRGHAQDGWAQFHSWDLYGDDTRPTLDPHAEPVVTYAIPLPPPVGRSVTDRWDHRWTVQPNGSVARSDDHDRTSPWSWHTFLNIFGPATLAELTEQERASEALYGPIGMRWADPDGPPCPYNEHRGIPREDQPDEYRPCALRIGHGGPHRDPAGAVLGEDSTMEGPIAVTPQQAARSLCTCGRPDQHQPGCPRYERMAHRLTARYDEEIEL